MPFNNAPHGTHVTSKCDKYTSPTILLDETMLRFPAGRDFFLSVKNELLAGRFGFTSNFYSMHFTQSYAHVRKVQQQENTFPIDFKFMEQFANESCNFFFLICAFAILFTTDCNDLTKILFCSSKKKKNDKSAR